MNENICHVVSDIDWSLETAYKNSYQVVNITGHGGKT